MRLRALTTLSILAFGCAREAPPTGTVSVTQAVLRPFEDQLQLDLEIENGTGERVDVYQRIRAVVRDEETDTTQLLLRDRPWTPTGGSADCHLLYPSTIDVGARSYESIELELPTAFQRLVEVREEDVVTEEIPVATAPRVTVEVAWSFDQFRNAPSGCSAELAEALIEKQDGVASATIVRD
jgi:hypothetical protein